MSNMGHTEVVNLVRAAPRVVDLVVGRVLEAPKPPIEAHLLPDIGFKGSQEPLGTNTTRLALFIGLLRFPRSKIRPSSPDCSTCGSIARFGAGWRL